MMYCDEHQKLARAKLLLKSLSGVSLDPNMSITTAYASAAAKVASRLMDDDAFEKFLRHLNKNYLEKDSK
jgi:ribosomal protein L12E/L44/L45/RPP1/RPP2